MQWHDILGAVLIDYFAGSPYVVDTEVDLSLRKQYLDIKVGPTVIRLLVIRELPDEPANAMLKLFSVVPEQIEFACRHYHPMSSSTTGIVDRLVAFYRKEDKKMEDKNMATTLEELNRKVMKELLEAATVTDRLRGLTPAQRLEGLPAEERVKGLPAEERVKGLPAEDRLKGLSLEEIEAYVQKLKRGNSSK